jgi:hypothetical protein
MSGTGERLQLRSFSIMRTSAANALRDLRVEALTATDAADLLDHVIAIEKAMAGLKLLLADRAAESGDWRARGARSPEEDLANRTGTGVRAAKEALRASKRVKGQPRVEEALRDGKLSVEQAALVTDAAEANPAAETKLVETATSGPVTRLRDECGRAKAAGDRDPEATRRRLHKERFFRYGKAADGSMTGSFKLAPDAGAELDVFFQPFLRAEARRAKNERRSETVDQLSADALVAMARAATTGGATSGTKTKAEVHVIVDRDSLLRGSVEGDEVCEMSTCFGPISVPVSVAQEIIDDAFVNALFLDGIDVQSVVRFGRHVPAAVREALRIRDDFTCEVPGCNRRAGLEVDHHEPVSEGGLTRYRSLGHKCSWHHREKTNRDRERAKVDRTRTRLFDTDPDPP